MRLTKRNLKIMLITAFDHGKNNLSDRLWSSEYLPEMLAKVEE